MLGLVHQLITLGKCDDPRISVTTSPEANVDANVVHPAKAKSKYLNSRVKIQGTVATSWMQSGTAKSCHLEQQERKRQSKDQFKRTFCKFVLSPGQTVLPTRAKFTTSMELGIVWPPTWLELTRVGLSWFEFDQAQMFAQLEQRFPPFRHLSELKPTLAKLFCYCYVTTRSYN